MRQNYFGYYIEDERNGLKYYYDAREFIKAFCLRSPVNFRKTFIFDDENVYMFHVVGDMYLFVTTRSNEIIKKINSDNLDINEIYTALSDNENLGFASYLYFGNNFVGFSSTMLSPRVSLLISFFNELFSKISLEHYKLKINALLYQSTREEIMRMPFVGRTVIEINKDNSFTKEILATLGCDDKEESAEFESFEIIIKPQKRKNVEQIVKKFLAKLPDSGMQKFIAKAKEEISDSLTDLYIVGQGAISDDISGKDDFTIYEKIKAKILDNRLLEEKVQEFRQNGYASDIPQDILYFNNNDAWANILHRLQIGNSQ